MTFFFHFQVRVNSIIYIHKAIWDCTTFLCCHQKLCHSTFIGFIDCTNIVMLKDFKQDLDIIGRLDCDTKMTLQSKIYMKKIHVKNYLAPISPQFLLHLLLIHYFKFFLDFWTVLETLCFVGREWPWELEEVTYNINDRIMSSAHTPYMLLL